MQSIVYVVVFIAVVGFHKNIFVLIIRVTFAVKFCFNHTFLSGCNWFFWLVGNGASATGLHSYNVQRFVTCVFKMPAYFYYLAFIYFSQVLVNRIYPLKRSKIGRIF